MLRQGEITIYQYNRRSFPVDCETRLIVGKMDELLYGWTNKKNHRLGETFSGLKFQKQ